MLARRGAAILFMIAAVVGSCAGSPVVYYPTQLTSAQLMAAGAPELRTLDNTGFVYPSGATTEVSQGIAPAVVGRGGYMTVPPAGHPVGLPPLSRPPPSRSPSVGEDAAESVGRVASALCDHQTVCERIRPGGAFESPDACATEQRARLGEVVAKASCEATVSADLLAECLRVIRAASCVVDADAFSMPAPCVEALASCL
jgi:hypothetical protein